MLCSGRSTMDDWSSARASTCSRAIIDPVVHASSMEPKVELEAEPYWSVGHGQHRYRELTCGTALSEVECTPLEHGYKRMCDIPRRAAAPPASARLSARSAAARKRCRWRRPAWSSSRSVGSRWL